MPDTAPAGPAPIDPAPIDPAPIGPAPVDAVPAGPAPVAAVPTDAVPTDIALVDMDVRSPAGPRRSSRGARVDCYALHRTDLNRFSLVVLPTLVDQEYLVEHRDVIRDYLDGGGVLLFGGQLTTDWLPGGAPFVPLPNPSRQTYQVGWIADHPIFAGVLADDLTARRGVAGFFARGHHPLPPGAEVLVRLVDGEPTTYIDRASTLGTIVVQANSDLVGDGMPATSTANLVPDQFIAWARAEAAGRRAALAGLPADASPEPAAPAAGSVPSAGTPSAPPERPAPTTASALSAGRPAASSGSADASSGRPAWRPVAAWTAGTAPTGGLAAVYSGSGPHHRALTAPKYAHHFTGGLCYLPDLADVELTGLDGLVIPERMHRGMLDRAAGRVLELLEAGGTVVAFSGGEPFADFLPGVRWEHRPTNFWWWLEPEAQLGLRSPAPGHPLFDHITLRDCTWHYHGVLDPPEGAQTLVTLPSGEALLYVDEVSTPGTLIVTTLDPLHHFGGYFMPAAERFLDGFLPWLSTTVRPRVPNRT